MTRGLWLTIVLAAICGSAAIAEAQDRPDRPRRPRDVTRDRREGPPPRRDDDRPPPFDRGPRRGERPGPFGGPPPPATRLLRPSPEDEGPLAEGEMDELMAFAAEHMPELHERLARGQRDRPEAFERRFQFFAPRIRQFKRVYEQRPELFEALVSHARLMLRIDQFRREWRRVDGPPAERRFRQRLREFVAEKFDLETQFFEADLTARREHPDAFINAIVDRTLRDERSERIPPELRDLVREYSTADSQRQAEIRGQVREFVAEHFADELSHDEDHLRHRRDDAPRFVDGELDRMIARFRHGDDGPPPFAAPPPPPEDAPPFGEPPP
ncbi:MAG: hypothetical protein KDA32_04470 [Phycisphaerales bacterium]|nr:hypothetical protein [Phycisphaerales bacterium]